MDYDIFWKIHAILMGLSFASILTGILISLIYKKKKWRYKTHKRLGILGGSSGFVALLIAFLMIQTNGGGHFTSPHTIFGGITGLFLITTPIAGLQIRKMKDKKRAKRLHKAFGFTTFALMTITIISGLFFVGILYIP